MGEVDDWFAFALDLADLADARTLPDFRAAMDVRSKADGTFVTDTDEGVEQLLRERVAARFPDHAFLGEEDGLSGDPGRPTWIVDPIDGTNNFVTGHPTWATLIALQVDGREVLGVASAPALGSRWDGLVDGDRRIARQDGREVRVSNRALADGQVSFGGLRYFREGVGMAAVDRLTAATRRQRGHGDFWQHCLVAAGVIEVAIEGAVNPWDLAAVRCIVTAAGGRFSDLSGQDTIEGGSGLSTNGIVHDQVLALVAGVDS